MHGIPDDKPAVRAIAWLLLLGVLPVDRAQWRATVATKTEVYYELVHHVLHGDAGVLRRAKLDAEGGCSWLCKLHGLVSLVEFPPCMLSGRDRYDCAGRPVEPFRSTRIGSELGFGDPAAARSFASKRVQLKSLLPFFCVRLFFAIVRQ